MTDADIPEPTTRYFSAAAERLRGALLDSRQRWRDLMGLTADLAFETDHLGRLTFLHPDPALGWPTNAMVGGDASVLLADGGDGTGFDPFRATVRVRHRRAWLRRGDGGVVCLAFSAEPMLDSLGRITGVHGVGVDITALDAPGAQLAGAVRLGDALDHILTRMGREVLAPKMLRSALDALASALGAQGAAAILLPAGGEMASVAHRAGEGADSVLPAAAALLAGHVNWPVQSEAEDGRRLLADICQARFGEQTGLVAWRAATSRPWDTDEIRLLAAAGKIVRMALEHEAIQREMMRQARTDPLTGLLNRRAFREEVLRHTDRADRAEALRTAVPDALDELTGGTPPRVTLSIGIATRAVRADEDIDGLIRRADEAMYEAKRNGRGHWRVSLLDAG